MLKYLLIALCILTHSLSAYSQKATYNIDAEDYATSAKIPSGWLFGFDDNQRLSYQMAVDQQIKKSGKHSISIEKNTSLNTVGGERVDNMVRFAAITYPINKIFEGREIMLKGAIKTHNVKTGYAGLWMRIDGEGQSIAFDNMQQRGVKGTTDWQEYTVKLNYDSDQAKSIHIGGLLVGDGKAWFDGFELYIDGKPVAQAPEKAIVLSKAVLDTAFSNGSGISSIDLNPQVLSNLELTGQFWSFLKYHHPAIAKGDYNWDAELFRYLPRVVAAKSNEELSNILETWISALPGPGVPAKSDDALPDKKVAIQPNYGKLFDVKFLSETLITKLTAVKLCKRNNKHHYVSFVRNVGNPKFENELPYNKMLYPDAGYRLLTLYRYWAMINYFFPYKDVMDEDWNVVLVNSLPAFVQSKNEEEFALATLKLIVTVQDSHANIFSPTPALMNYKGKYKVPFFAEFIENKLVITEFPYGDTLQVKQKFKIGDVISSINGKPIDTLIKHYLPYTAASNYDTQLRNMPFQFLLRGNNDIFTLDVEREGKLRTEEIKTIPFNYYIPGHPSIVEQSYKMLDGGIGYVYPGKYKNMELPAIQELFKNTNGMIIDMRCYPSDAMPYTFGSYLKKSATPFVMVTAGNLSTPGLFTFQSTLSNGGGRGDKYKGKVVVIVNAKTQSAAEFATMAIQSNPNITVIGSTTSGADGNVSKIILPGGISTMISGIGIFYPDGTPTQRVGVKIDQVIKPTIKGIREGRDELLEAAKQIIAQSTSEGK